MSYLETKDGYNMYDMLSMMQKAIRRNDFEHAGFATDQVCGKFRKVMWNRLLVISAEDCYGTLTKEIVALKKLDDEEKKDKYVAEAVALMCRSLKSRDACYFACNFMIVSRKPRDIIVTKPFVEDFEKKVAEIRQKTEMKEQYDESGFQLTFDSMANGETRSIDFIEDAARLAVAVKHRDMDMIGWYVDKFRKRQRNLIWETFVAIANDETTKAEIEGLWEADNIVNKNRKDDNEIFTSKAVMVLCYDEDPTIEDVRPCDIVDCIELVDWSKHKVKPIADCKLKKKKIPEWVFDCHTIRGKQMGKTDWDMTLDEQAALNPLANDYFSEASWLPIYELDYENNDIDLNLISKIREYGETHPVNPVEFVPYE